MAGERGRGSYWALRGQGGADAARDIPCTGVELCAQLEMLCLQYPDVSGMDMLVPQTQVQKLCARLRVEENNRQMQTTLNRFWSKDGAPT